MSREISDSKQQEDNKKLEYALRYAEDGWFVHPLCWPTENGECGCGRSPAHTEKEIGKAPITHHGEKDATTNPDIIRRWWEKWPEANIGINLGLSKLVAVDTDSKNAEEEAKSLGLPATRVHRTAKGYHHIYLNPWSGKANAIRKGKSGAIDILTTGYVVVPPSCHRNGEQYELVVDEPLANAPDWVLGMLRDKKTPSQVKLPASLPAVDLDTLNLSAKTIELIKTGKKGEFPSRSEAGFSVIASMIKQYRSDAEIAAVILRNPIGAYIYHRNPNNPETWLAKEIGRARAKMQEPSQNIGGDRESNNEESSPPKFFSEGRVIPSELAKYLIAEFQLITYGKSRQIFSYTKDGFYSPSEEELIRKEVCEILGKQSTTHHVKEVVGHIKYLSYQSAENLKPPDNLVCLSNGILNLETRKLQPHSPRYFFRQRIPVAYDSEASCPEIDKFLEEILPQDRAAVIEELFGFCLEPGYRIKKAFALVGKPDTGKSTLLRLLEQFLGEKNCSAQSLQSFHSNHFSIANLDGKLANICADLPRNSLTDTSFFKQLTGQDLVPAERKYEQGFEFYNRAKLIFSANRLPRSMDQSDAFFVRWVIIDLPRPIPEEGIDPDILEKLTTPAELSGLLNHALKGLERLQARGAFSVSETVKEIRSHYRRSSDPIEAFLEECVRVDPEKSVTKSNLYSALCSYCQKHAVTTPSKEILAKRVRSTFFINDFREQVNGKRVRIWPGISLNAAGEALLKTVNGGEKADLHKNGEVYLGSQLSRQSLIPRQEPTEVVLPEGETVGVGQGS